MGSHSVTGHPTQVNPPRLNPSYQQASWYTRLTLTYPAGMKGWVDLGGWLYTEMVYLSADSQPPK